MVYTVFCADLPPFDIMYVSALMCINNGAYPPNKITLGER